MSLKISERRDTVCYGYIKERNKKWLEDQAKKHKIKLSPLLDMYLDQLRLAKVKKRA